MSKTNKKWHQNDVNCGVFLFNFEHILLLVLLFLMLTLNYKMSAGNVNDTCNMQSLNILQTFFFCVESTISHINYWHPLNSWKNFWKFCNGPRCRNKSGPSPLLNVAVIGRVPIPKLEPRNCLRYLQTTLIMGEGGLVSKFMWGIV